MLQLILAGVGHFTEHIHETRCPGYQNNRDFDAGTDSIQIALFDFLMQLVKRQAVCGRGLNRRQLYRAFRRHGSLTNQTTLTEATVDRFTQSLKFGVGLQRSDCNGRIGVIP